MNNSSPEPLIERSSGLLLHPTSLPGPFGIGELGPAAFAWIETLARARQRWWQILPLGLTGYGNSPYQSLSAFAGNIWLISLDVLVQEGFLKPGELAEAPFPPGRVDYDGVFHFKGPRLRQAWGRFQVEAAPALREAFQQFCVSQRYWLDEFALYLALKESFGGISWLDWPRSYALREARALAQARQDRAAEIDYHRFCQFLFFRQWSAVKKHAHRRGVGLIGDLPIFVATDSADVWANPEFFLLDENRRPTVVAGVPPDYFAAQGQRWGNPIYRWGAMAQTDYAWWVHRLRATLEQVDLVRLDHFRGFEACYHIPADHETAEQGEWKSAPGAHLLGRLQAALGCLPVIAEDLGLITPPVDALRRQFGLPGMRILQFAFGGATENRFLPHRFERNTVVYTGTHDNDTTQGWYTSLTAQEKAFFHEYTAAKDGGPAWTLIRLAWASVADLAVAPVQDLLRLGREARLNTPGTAEGNWTWRMTPEMLSSSLLDQLGHLTDLYERFAGNLTPTARSFP